MKALWTLLGSFAVAVLFANGGASAGSSPDLEFADWTSVFDNAASGTVRGRTVSLSGTNVPAPGAGSVVDGTSTEFADPFFTPPLPQSDAIAFYGNDGWSYTLQFGAPTIEPVIHIASLASELEFPAGTQITRVSGEPGFTVAANLVTGELAGSQDRGGTIRLTGTHESLHFTTDPVYDASSSPDAIFLQVGAGPQAPETTITDGPSGAVWNPDVRFSFTATVPGSTFECRLDGAGFAPCSSPHLAGVQPSGPHSFEVRAVNPAGPVDATPARREFTINGPLSYGATCKVDPFEVFGSLISADERYPTACDVARRPSGCRYPAPYISWDEICERRDRCWLTDRCVWREHPCPEGARCRVETRMDWFDDDFQVNWTPYAAAGFAEYDAYFRKAPGYRRCKTGFDGNRCSATATASILGDGRPARGRCGLEFNLYDRDDGLGDPRQLGALSRRRLECDVSIRIEPAQPLSAAASAVSVLINSPGSGLISIIVGVIVGGGSSADADAAARRKPPKIAKVRKRVSRAGPVRVKLTLNKPAKRLLRRRGQMRVKLAIRFTATNGAKTRRTERVTLTQPRSKRAKCLAQPAPPKKGKLRKGARKRC